MRFSTFLFGFLIFSISLSAQITWTGATDSDWATASNWSSATVPTATDDVIIPDVVGTFFDPIITTAAVALSVTVNVDASLTLDPGSSLSIDGSTGNGITNSGTINNDGTINLGLSTQVIAAGLFNSGIFVNDSNGQIFCDLAGGSSVGAVYSVGTFTNSGFIEITNNVSNFGLEVKGGVFLNNSGARIDVYKGLDRGILLQNSTLNNYGVIEMFNSNGGINTNVNSTFNNFACGEYYSAWLGGGAAASSVNNSGLMSFYTGSFTGYMGTWNNTGTIHNLSSNLGTSPPTNDDLIIQGVSLTNNCGELSPAFGIGPNLGSTVFIYTDAAATASAGNYNVTTNTFTPNFALSNTTYNLFVKVEDISSTCPDYILEWNLTVTTAPCCDITTWTGNTDSDWDELGNWDTYLVPTGCNHVVIPNVTNQPVIDGTTAAVAISGIINTGASLDISAGGILSIDGTTTFVPNIAFENLGALTNNGTMNFGLNALVGMPTAFKNAVSATFINNGSLITDEVGVSGGQTLFNQGDFQNNGFIELGAGSIYFGILNSGATSNFDNFGRIDCYLPVIENIFVSDNSIFENFGVIDIFGTTRGLRLSVGSTFHNHECGEYYSDANVNSTGYINNEGFWHQTVNTVNAGTWDNTGTMSLNQLTYLGTPINNDDIVIFRKNFTNTCGDIIPNTFDIGITPGSTLSIYTDAAATTSAGTYDIASNTFTSNAHMPEGLNTLYIKIVDDAPSAPCPDFIVPWIVDVIYGATEVTQTGDTGTGSLRCAIIQANSFPGANTITFDIVGTAPHSILLTADLPPVTDALTTIDATMQPGWSLGDIVLDGANSFNGIALFEADCSIKGIHFDNIDGFGIFADNLGNSGDAPTIEDCAFSNISTVGIELLSADNATIDNCFVGTNVFGTAGSAGTAVSGISANSGTGLFIKNCTVSGFNSTNDVGVSLTDCNSPIIEDCFIGTDFSGISPISNDIGIQLDNCTNYLIQRNTISHNLSKGILVE